MDTQIKSGLFETDSFKGFTLKNRIVMAPMTRSRAIGGVPNELMELYYSQRSSAGLIISEGTSPSPNGLGYSRIPGIFSEEQVNGWRKITKKVHGNESKIFMQLMHTGRIAHQANMPAGAKIVGPSPVRAKGNMWTDLSGMQPHSLPEQMSAADIQKTIQEFTQAAKNAVKAGFDGVEIHGANGYLLEQFLNPHVNIRTDEYGGSITNRLRFVLEVTASIVEAIGKDKVGIRLSPYGTFNDMPKYEQTFETYSSLVQELNKLNIGYIHIIESSARVHEDGNRLLVSMRENFQNIWMVNGGYTREKAEAALEAGHADLVSFGSPFISNPDLPERIKNDIPLTTPDANTFYSADEKGYTDYPFYA